MADDTLVLASGAISVFPVILDSWLSPAEVWISNLVRDDESECEEFQDAQLVLALSQKVLTPSNHGHSALPNS